MSIKLNNDFNDRVLLGPFKIKYSNEKSEYQELKNIQPRFSSVKNKIYVSEMNKNYYQIYLPTEYYYNKIYVVSSKTHYFALCNKSKVPNSSPYIKFIWCETFDELKSHYLTICDKYFNKVAMAVCKIFGI